MDKRQYVSWQDRVPEGMICEKAKRLHDDLVKNILVQVVIVMFSKLAQGGLRNLRK